MLRSSFRIASRCLRKRSIRLHSRRAPPAASYVSLRACSTVSDGSSASMVRDVLRAAEEDPAIIDELSLIIEKNVEMKDNIAALLKQCAGQEVTPPNSMQLRKLALAAALPYFGFGVLDNAIMISIGDALDTTLCVTFGLSTMAAAGLGNTVSDAFGVVSGGVVEDVAQKYGIESPPLSRAQEEMPITKRWERLGQLVGIMIGCIFGMFPLLFIDPSAAEKLKRDQKMEDVYKSVMENVASVLEAEFAQLLLVDQQGKSLTRRSSAKSISLDDSSSRPAPASGSRWIFAPDILEGSVAQKAIRTGNFFNIADIRNSEHYIPRLHDSYQDTGVPVRSILCMPVFSFDAANGTSKPVGVLQVINKEGDEKFSRKDENVVAALCSHISTFIGASYGDDQGFRHILSVCERSLNTHGVRINAAEDMRAQTLYAQVMHDISQMVSAAATQLLVHDDKSDELIMKVSDNIPFFRNAAHKGIMGKVYDQGRTILVNDLRQSPYYDPDRHDNYQGTGIPVSAVLATPCISNDGKVLAVLECFKSKRDEFLPEDVNLLESAAAAIAINLEGSGASLRHVLAEMHKLHSKGLEGNANDCRKEVASILESTARLVKKAGGRVDGLLPEWQLQQFLDGQGSGNQQQ